MPGRERALHPENQNLNELGHIVGHILEQIIQGRIPTALNERIKLVVDNGLPILEFTSGTTHVLLSVDCAGMCLSFIKVI